MPPALATMAARPRRMLENAATGAAHAPSLMGLSDPFSTMASRPRSLGRVPTQAVHAPTPMPARPNPTPMPHAASGIQSSPANQALPGYQQHDRRLYDVQQKLQARGALSPQRQKLLGAVTKERQGLGNEMMQRASDPEHVMNQLRSDGKEVAIGRAGLSKEDELELSRRAMAPRRSSPNLSARLPAFDMASYNKTAPFQGEHAGAREIARTIGTERMRNQMIPQAIMPAKVGAWAKPVSSLLAAIANKAHGRPDLADAAIRAGDKALLHGAIGTLLGGAGGALIAPQGHEGDGALRGALTGAVGGASIGGGLGWRDARKLPVDAARFNGIRGAAGRRGG